MSSLPVNQCAHDARAVANLLLARADGYGIAVTNLALQKLIYFAHGLMLRRHNRPLVDGYFEAWEFGPVHPLLYATFKGAGRVAISEQAMGRDFRTGARIALAAPVDAAAVEILDEVLAALGRQPASSLVRISHARGGPWHEVVNESGTRTRFGLRISDILIRERFHRHMVMVRSDDRIGDVVDESPPA
ncbi:type VI toxin-antitoxin system SocA family antitoxin [Brevundimonas sp.]|uniref:type VI toxin-antitoxin system SocA family antitoxin n=1 Tax=Brevundimonas sp. TaxID=1871086 RepID=UPI003F70FEC3